MPRKTTRRMRLTAKPPKVSRVRSSDRTRGFPVDHYSYSFFTKMTTNAIMARINNVNGDSIETTVSPANLLGRSIHKGLQRYLGGNPEVPTSADEGEAIKEGMDEGFGYLQSFSEGNVTWTDSVPGKTALEDRYLKCYLGYVSEFPRKEIKEIVMVERMLKHVVSVEGRDMPVPLKGSADLVYMDHSDRMVIWDHKITGRYSDDEDIDGPKLVQAAFMFFITYAETGIRPYKMVFAEYKSSKNKDGSNQMRPYEVVYEEVPLLFDLFYRLYEDITNCLLGKYAFLPNLTAMFDKEVSIMSYILRLDDPTYQQEQFEKAKVTNITDFLKKKIEKSRAMKKYMDSVAKNFISSTTLNYSTMETQEKIKMKLAEHGLSVNFDSKVTGNTVELYRYEPSIGLKMSRLETFAKDIEQVVGKTGIRVLAPIQDSNLVGFEVPLDDRTFPSLPENRGFEIAIGKTVMGQDRFFDIRTAPHMLVAGSAGSGKSVFLNNLIRQLISLPKVELHLFDPKQVELFQHEPHAKEYASDHESISYSIHKLTIEMNERYTRMKEAGVRNISEMPRMKYKFVIIDEYADLTERQEIREMIQKLAQMGRACGIHLIIATQRASTKVISGDIKVNFPVKAVFRMAKSVDSRVMLDEDGAEKLLGRGDMLFSSESGIERLQSYL